MWGPQRALVTGASGFVGTWLCQFLLECGDDLLACSRFARWPDHCPTELSNTVELLPWDLSQQERPPSFVEKTILQFSPTVIYHLAAESVPARCGKERPTRQAQAVNVDGTRRVLELACRLQSHPVVLVVSSSHVYAPVTSEQPKVNEAAPLAPVSAYGQTKLQAERLAHEYFWQRGCQTIIVRAFHHTGPGQKPPMIIPQWASQIAANTDQPVQIYSCNTWLDLCDVRDVVRAYRLLAQFGEPGTAYNVGSGINRRSGDILTQLLQIADCHRPVVELHPGFHQEPIADITRLCQATGWKPEIPLEKTLSDTYQWWCQRLACDQSG